MELRQLRHFVTLAEEMHFGRAAQRLYMTQPPLSSSIMRLEEDLGVRLFDRDSKHVTLTPAGSMLLVKAREIVFQAEKVREFAKAVSAGSAGRIEVGFTGTLLYRGLPAILSRFKADYPQIEVGLREIGSQEQMLTIREGRLDAGFINTPVAPAGLEHLVIYRECYMVCLPTSHRLAGEECVRLADLAGEPFVMFGRHSSPASYDHVISLCDRAGFHPTTSVEVGQLLSVVAMVASGLGVAVVPKSVSNARISGVVFLPFEGSEVRPTAFLIWSAESSTPGLAAFVETAAACGRDREDVMGLKQPG